MDVRSTFLKLTPHKLSTAGGVVIITPGQHKSAQVYSYGHGLHKFTLSTVGTVYSTVYSVHFTVYGGLRLRLESQGFRLEDYISRLRALGASELTPLRVHRLVEKV